MRRQIAKKKAYVPEMFSIRWKLNIFLIFLTIIFSSAGAYGLYGIYSISNFSRKIIEQNTSVDDVIKEALLAQSGARVAFSQILGVKEFSEINEIRNHEALLNDSILRFDMYIASITWGSESEAFLKSDGGLNFSKWNSLGLAGKLKVMRPSSEQIKLAGLADLYFGAFASNSFKSIASHKKSLRLASSGDDLGAEKAQGVSEEFEKKATRFSDLAGDSLSRIVELSNIDIRNSGEDIEGVQNRVGIAIFVIFTISIGASLFLGVVFIRKTISEPLKLLTVSAEKISGGDFGYRAQIKGSDEISILARAFNDMADSLSKQPKKLALEVKKRTAKLTEANKRLEGLLNENYVSAKLLVQKDREFTKANMELSERNKELDDVAKMLVRRDLELTSANEMLEELDTMKSEFVSIAAHQLRTPITGIKWTLNSLIDGEFGEVSFEQRNIIHDALKTIEQLTLLIDNLLDVSRVEEGRLKFKSEVQALNPIVKKSVRKFEVSAKSKGVSIITKFTPAKLFVNADEERVGMVIDNLLDNAVKYTPPGGSVFISMSKDKNQARVEVKDTGIGIEKSQQDRVFSKFFRSDKAQLLQTSGTGLGLFLVKKLAEKHGGTISFKSKEGKGSTFYFLLPLVKTKGTSLK